MTQEAVDFTSFVRANSQSLYGTAFLLTGNALAAEDLLQDTLTALYPKWSRVAAAEHSLAYVRRALVNRHVSSTRRTSARDLAVWDLRDGPTDVDVAVVVSDRRLLWQLLLTLPERQRAALVLRYFHDVPDAEIASALGCREVTVRSLVSRGLAALRTRAAETEPRGGEPR